MDFDLETVITASVAAQRINGQYVRRDQGTAELPANSHLIIRLLNPSEEEPHKILPEDRTEARLILEYLSHKVMDLIAGELEDYWKNAVLMLDIRNIQLTDFNKIGLIASIPASYANAIGRERLMSDMKKMAGTSRHFGNVGDKFPLQPVQIVGSIYSRTYLKYYHTALTAEGNMIRFPNNAQQATGQTVHISGKIHKHGDNNTTVLHYAKVHKNI